MKSALTLLETDPMPSRFPALHHHTHGPPFHASPWQVPGIPGLQIPPISCRNPEYPWQPVSNPREKAAELKGSILFLHLQLSELTAWCFPRFHQIRMHFSPFLCVIFSPVQVSAKVKEFFKHISCTYPEAYSLNIPGFTPFF